MGSYETLKLKSNPIFVLFNSFMTFKFNLMFGLRENWIIKVFMFEFNCFTKSCVLLSNKSFILQSKQ